MIKSTILQNASRLSRPSELLQYLNQTLLHLTAGNFITAFYGVFNSESRELVFSNAGHNSPFIIGSQGVSILQSPKASAPLSVMDNTELKEEGKEYQDELVSLEKGSKLLLYTDGLVEAVNIIESNANPMAPDFEHCVLSGILEQYKALPSKEFINKIVEKLVEFRGFDSFEDDVCMVCLDIK